VLAVIAVPARRANAGRSEGKAAYRQATTVAATWCSESETAAVEQQIASSDERLPKTPSAGSAAWPCGPATGKRKLAAKWSSSGKVTTLTYSATRRGVRRAARSAGAKSSR
jgi:hypothetical protein